MALLAFLAAAVMSANPARETSPKAQAIAAQQFIKFGTSALSSMNVFPNVPAAHNFKKAAEFWPAYTEGGRRGGRLAAVKAMVRFAEASADADGERRDAVRSADRALGDGDEWAGLYGFVRSQLLPTHRQTAIFAAVWYPGLAPAKPIWRGRELQQQGRELASSLLHAFDSLQLEGRKALEMEPDHPMPIRRAPWTENAENIVTSGGGRWRELSLMEPGGVFFTETCKNVLPQLCALIRKVAVKQGAPASWNERADNLDVVPAKHWPGIMGVRLSAMQGAEVKGHHGPTNTRIRMHLPLIVPAGAGYTLSVRDGSGREETLPIEERKPFFFDDSYRHHVDRKSKGGALDKQWRLVLIVDFWHPAILDARARDALGKMMLEEGAKIKQAAAKGEL